MKPCVYEPLGMTKSSKWVSCHRKKNQASERSQRRFAFQMDSHQHVMPWGQTGQEAYGARGQDILSCPQRISSNFVFSLLWPSVVGTKLASGHSAGTVPPPQFIPLSAHGHPVKFRSQTCSRATASSMVGKPKSKTQPPAPRHHALDSVCIHQTQPSAPRCSLIL